MADQVEQVQLDLRAKMIDQSKMTYFGTPVR